jgi:lactate racemase
LNKIALRSGVWYGEELVNLHFPRRWDLNIFWPRPTPALSASQIVASLDHPIGQPAIRELCRGKSSPLVIVDDPNRPTPVSHVLPWVFEQFRQANIDPRNVRILIANGTHAPPRLNTILKKVGREAFKTCKVQFHCPDRNLVKVGVTSWGTPVEVNREVLRSDFVVGIGGIYPNHTAGFGGGSKLALGVLGFRSIRHLHYSHQAVGWSTNPQKCSFRQDLDEISRLIGLNTMISIQVNANREIIRLDCGDPVIYFDGAAEFCREAFTVPEPGDADVVISNAYPNDLSLTFASMKGMTPLYQCGPGASRVVIAACSEGFGHHRLFPRAGHSWVWRKYQKALQLKSMGPRLAAKKITRYAIRKIRTSANGPSHHEPRNPVWLFRPQINSEPLRHTIPFIRVAESWEEILDAVTQEQGGRKYLRAVVYPCAPLQVLKPEAEFFKPLPAAENDQLLPVM